MNFNPYAAVLLTSLAVAVTTPHAVVADGEFAKFDDPLEHAFSLDVPSRWTARGGMFRIGYSDFRPMVDLKSPDGKTSIRAGDVAIPRDYALPTPQHPRDGEADDLGAQAQLIYAKYRTGKDYAKLYALARFKTLCRDLTPQPNAWSPASSGATSPRGSAGSVTYRCDAKAGGIRTAYVYAETERAADAPSLWGVTSLVSFVTPLDRIAAVHAIIARGTETFTLSRSWIAYQKTMEAKGLQYQIAIQRGRRAAMERQIAEFSSRMRGMQTQVDSFERGQATSAGNFQGFDNAVNGITPTVDPLNGEMRDVWTGPNNGYWVNGAGTIVNSNGSPGSGFHALQPH